MVYSSPSLNRKYMKYCTRSIVVLISTVLLVSVAVWWLKPSPDKGVWPTVKSDPAAVIAAVVEPHGAPAPAPAKTASASETTPQVDSPAMPQAPSPALSNETAWRIQSPAPAANAFANWTRRYQNAPDQAMREALIPEGMQLARERRDALFRLIQNDPEAALDAAVPWAVRAGLPEEITALLEERVSGRGDLEVVCVNPIPGAVHDHDAFQRTATLHQLDYRAFVYGARTGQPTTEDVPLHGISLSQGEDRVLALSENPLRILGPAESDAHLVAHPDAALAGAPCAYGAHPISNQDVVVLMDVGGAVQAACDHEHAAALSEELLAAALAGEPPSFDFPNTTGRKRVIMYRIAFADIPSPALSQSAAMDLIVEMNDYWSRVSYGLMTIAPAGQGSDIVQVNLTGNGSDYNDDDGRLRSESEAAAIDQGYDLSQYNYRVFFTGSSPSFSWCGLGSVGGGNPWSMVRCLNVGVTMHELGHNLGFWHGNYWDTDGESAMGPGENEEYGDPFDVMGSSGNEGDYTVKYKNQIGWVSNEDYPFITESGRYRIFTQDNPDSYGLRGLRYRPTGSLSWSHDDVSLEFRRAFTGNSWLTRGLGVRWGYSGGTDRSQLVDTTPGSPNGKNDSAIVIGRTFADVDSDVYITPVSFGNTYPESLDVVVNFGPFPGNQAPIIVVRAAAASAELGSPLTFTATASDPDGDELAYHWDFGDGTISENTTTAVHGWAASGDYVARCTVSDMKGGVASHAAVVRVGNPTTFQISGRVYQSGEPVPGVLVKVSNDRYDVTGSDGSYTITRLNAGSYSVTAQKYPLSFANPWFANPVSVGPSSAENVDFLAVDIDLNDVTLVAQNAAWRYLDDGSNQGTAWRNPGFVDSGWASGPAELGYGDDDLGTVVGYGPDEDNKYITTYFRRTFTAPDPATITNLFLEVHRDDGVVVYLNGTEILRDNMPGGTITFTTEASDTADGNVTAEVPHALLQAGENVLAAEIHQANSTSSDISFYARFLATTAANLNDLQLVYIASPSDQDVIVQSASVPITVNAFNNSGSYTNVEFFVDGVSLGEDSSEPFSISWQTPPLGSHTLSIEVHDQAGTVTAPAPVTVEIVEDTAPPAPTQTLIAQGADWKFLDNGSNQGTAWKEPGFDDAAWASGPAQLGYGDGDEQTLVEDNPTPGYQSSANDRYITTYFRHAFMVDDLDRIQNLSARILRDDGAVVYVNGTEAFRSNMPGGTPTFTTAADDAVGGADEDEFFGMAISPSLLVPGLNVAAVEIHQSDSGSSDISFDFSLNALLTPPPPPGVALISPADGARLQAAPVIPLQAWATPASGQSISSVTFYDGLEFLGTDTDSPFTWDWTGAEIGDHQLTVVALESGGIMHTSPPILITVAYPGAPRSLISAGAEWKYLDTGRPPDASWTGTDYHDASWLVGAARLGYGGDGESTIVSYGGNSAVKHITTWFRRTFKVDDPATYDMLRLRLQRDDGALVYLNGVEVFRSNLLPGIINENSLAVTAVGNEDESAWWETLADAGLLQDGPNVIAVEVHQSTLDSSDLGFDLELTGLISTNLSQGIYLTEPADGSVFSTSSTVALEAYTTGLGAIEIVEFYDGPAKLGETSSAPFVLDWAGPAAGEHQLTARVTYDGGAVLTSPAVHVFVNAVPVVINPVRFTYIVSGTSWRFQDNGMDLGSAWRQPVYDESGWKQGASRLGYGLDGEVTTVESGNVTTYYRRSFIVPDPALLEALSLRLQRDDGAVVYLNGQEIHRSNLPGAEIDFDTLALSTADGLAEQYYHEATVPVAGSGITSGFNLLAVEIHQSSANSSDSGFDLELIGQGTSAPRIYLSQPSSGAAFPTSAAIAAEAFAWPGSGRTIARVEFFAGTNKVGEATERPFRIQWAGGEPGFYALTAMATDDLGNALTSLPVEVAVGFEPTTRQLITPGSNWRYHDRGLDLGTAWAQPGYDEAGWGFGPARLGYGGDGESTTVSFGPSSDSKYITTYFRHAFDVPEDTSLNSLTFRLQRDDGAVVWFDGVEAFRDNMPGGPISFSTLASGAIPNADEQAWFQREIAVSPLAAGSHVVAVEIHQGSANSSDLGFDLELLGSGLQIMAPPPPLTIEQTSGTQVRLSWPAPSEGWRLQSKSSLDPSVLWQDVPNVNIQVGGRWLLFVSPMNSRFYRLIYD